MAESNPNEYMRGYQDALDALRQKIDSDPLVRLSWNRPYRPAVPLASPVGGTEPPSSPLVTGPGPSQRQHVWVGLARDLRKKADQTGGASWLTLIQPLMDQADKEVDEQTKTLAVAGVALDRIASDCAVLTTERDGLKVLWEQAKADLRRARDEVDIMSRKVNRLTVALDSEKRDNARAIFQRNEAQMAVNQLRSDQIVGVGDLNGRLNEVEAQRSAIKDLATQRKDEVDRLQGVVDLLHGHVSRLRRLVEQRETVPLAVSYPEVYAKLKELAKKLLEVSMWPPSVSFSGLQERRQGLRVIAEDIRDAIGYGDEPDSKDVCERCGQPSGSPRCIPSRWGSED